MSAPAPIGSQYTGSSGATGSLVVSITSGFTAGSSVLVGFSQLQTTQRAITSIVDSGGNAYAQEAANTAAFGSYVWACHNIAAVGAGGTLTITFGGGTTIPQAVVQEFPQVSSAALNDTKTDAGSVNSHTSGATGLTTAGDVLVFCAGALNSASGLTGQTATAPYVRLSLGNQTYVGYAAQAGTFTNTTGPWAHTGTARINAGCMAAFYDAVPSAPLPLQHSVLVSQAVNRSATY